MPKPPLWVCQCSSTALCQWKMGWASHSQLFGLYSQPQGYFMLSITFEAQRRIWTMRPGSVFQLGGPAVHCSHILLACQDAAWVCNCLPPLPSPPCHASGFPLERKLGLRAGEWVLWWTPDLDSHSVSYGSPQTNNNMSQSLTWHSRITVGWAVVKFWAPETCRLGLQWCFWTKFSFPENHHEATSSTVCFTAITTSRDELRCNCFGELFVSVLTDPEA